MSNNSNPSGHPGRPSWRHDWVWFVVSGVLVAVLVLLALRGLADKSPTYDEPNYLSSGYSLVTSFRFDRPGTILHPPLTYYLHGLLARFHFGPELTPAKVYWSRVLMLVFPVVLAVFVFLWSRELFGGLAATGAVLLVCFSPNILAHGRLVTTDAAVSAFFLAAIWAYRRVLTGRGRWWVLWTGLLTGVALLCEDTALLLVPTMLLILAGMYLLRLRGAKYLAPGRWTPLVGTLLAFVVALVVVHAGYGFKDSLRPVGEFDFQSRLFRKVASLPVVGRLPAPLPAPYILGVDVQQRNSEMSFPLHVGALPTSGGVGYYFYFPLAILIKVPVAMLLLTGLTVFVLVRYRPVPPHEVLFAAVPAVFLLFYCTFLNDHHILRYLLPMFPFVYVLAGAVFAQCALRRPVFLPYLVTPLAAWYVAACLFVSPHYLAYFNELVGGPRNGWRWLAGSDLAWGQDRDRAIEYVKAKMKAGQRIRFNPGLVPVTGEIVIDANELQDVVRVRPDRAWLRRFTPVDHIGYSHLIFRLGVEDYRHLAQQHPEDPEARFALAAAYLDREQYAHARGGLRGLFELDAQHARGHYVASLLAWREAHSDEALVELEKAISLDPQFILAHQTRAVLLLLAGRVEQADRAHDDSVWNEMQLAHVRDVPFKAHFYEPAVELGQAEPWHHNNLALIRWRQGRLVDAEAHARQAVVLDPELLVGWSTLAWVLWQREKPTEALDAVNRYHVLFDSVGAHRDFTIPHGGRRICLGRTLSVRPGVLSGLSREVEVVRGTATSRTIRELATSYLRNSEPYLALRAVGRLEPVTDEEREYVRTFRRGVLSMYHLAP